MIQSRTVKYRHASKDINPGIRGYPTVDLVMAVRSIWTKIAFENSRS